MKQAIEKFWQWFSEHELELRSAPGKIPLHSDLGDRLAQFGFFDWEIGPLDSKGNKHFLSIQLSDFNDDGVRLRKDLLSAAPPNLEWEFLTLRPPKDWSRQLIWGKNRVLVFAADWKFSLYKYDDGKFDIVLNSQLPSGILNNEKRDLAICVLTSELGEAVLYEKVNAIDVEEKPASALDKCVPLGEVGSVLSDNFREA